jgi:AmiR/NasT family two-component response regulator
MGMDAKREWKFDNQVSQAAGMVSVQAECTVDEALLKLSEFARSRNQTMHETAVQVVERRLRFS